MSERFIYQENIRRFCALLRSASDPAQARTLTELLAAERRKLDALGGAGQRSDPGRPVAPR